MFFRPANVAFLGLVALLVTEAGASAGSDLRFALSYGDHMVLQQAPAAAAVWGFTPDGAGAVNVALESAHGSMNVSATVAPYNSTAFTWHAVLPPTKAARGGDSAAVAFTVTVRQGVASASIQDVLFGEVWVCSGQSNVCVLAHADGSKCGPPLCLARRHPFPGQPLQLCAAHGLFRH